MPTRIGQRLAATVKDDNKVTREEAEQFVASAKAERKWTPAMQAEVSTFIAKKGSKIDPQAKAVLEDFLAGAKPKTDLRDPLALKKHRTDVTWTPVSTDTTLYVDGIKADDVMQGYIGDCYLASGLSSLAAASPEVFEKAIKNNGDGTYTVRFFQGVGEGGRPKPVYVTVDDDMPRRHGEAVYLSARDSKELWPGLVEKAYAKWKGGYERIGNGGNASDLFEVLSGKASSWGDLVDYKPNTLFNKLQSAVSRHRPVSAGTFAEDAKNVSYTNTGVHADHFYTVLGASEEGGVKMVTLRNPWGFSEPSGNGPDDGIFKLPFTDFQKLFQSVEFGG